MKSTRTWITDNGGNTLGFYYRTQGGFFRAYVTAGVGVGPFTSAPEARQYIWNASK